MPTEPAGASKHEVERKLKQLRDSPVDTQGTRDSDMIPLHWRLMRVKADANGTIHWFCPQADVLTKELAVFLLRLFAYSNERVVEWRTRITKVWHGCANCVRGMDEAKTTSRTTYFGAFPENTVSRFWTAFENFEVQTIVEALRASGITPESSKTLADAPSPLVYHILSKPASFKDSFILQVIASKPFLPRAIDWPMDPPPPGYFLLVLHEDKEIRDWAVEHTAKAKAISLDQIPNCNLDIALQVVMRRITAEHDLSKFGSQKSAPLAVELVSIFPFSQSQGDIWAGFASLLHLLPGETIMAMGVHRKVIGHLHDNDKHFREVLRCMLHILKKLGSKLWNGESADYPQVVFDSIKDNPSYIALMLDFDSRKENPWFLFMFSEYLRSVWDMQVFGDIIAKFTAFMYDELQHERFEEKRPLIMSVATQVLSAAVTKATKLKNAPSYQAVMNVLDIHSDLIVAISSSPEYDQPQWASARQATLSLMRLVLSSDIDNLAGSMINLSVMEPTIGYEEVTKFFSPIRQQLWQKIYHNVSGKDTDKTTMLLALAARSAKLDKLSKRAISRGIWKHFDGKDGGPPKELLKAVDSAVDAVNHALSTIRDGLLDSVTKYANYASSQDLLDTLRQNDVAKHLIFMMLSPVEDLNTAAQTLIGQAYDVDVRADCFRELLKAVPGSCFQGLYDYVTNFNTYALKVTEACSVSKALVRCMTDVIEVLGNSPDGLLKDAAYVKKNTTDAFSLKKELPKLWKAMTKSIAVIFRRTPRWAVYFDNKVMLEWMRDALIFARDLLDRRKAFEAATLVVSDQDVMASPRKTTPFGKIMVEDLQDVLSELQAWLRLTDMELLYQSFALLKSLFQCFRETDVKPSAEALAKLNKFIDANKVSQDDKRVSFLNQASLSELELAVAEFDEDDEVEIISVSRKRKEKERDSSPEVVDVEAFVKPKAGERSRHHLSREEVKSTKQTKLQFPFKTSSAGSTIKKIPRIQQKPVLQPVASTSAKREVTRGPKFEGSRVSRPSSRPTSAESSSSNDSDEDEDGRGLAALINYQKKQQGITKKVKQPTERRQIRLIEDPMINARNAAQERMRKYEDARRNAMRLKPDITPLHRTILSWNYDHDGPEPPTAGEKPRLVRVPDHFRDHQEYLRIFEPLLKLECWSQIVKSKEETAPEVYECKIVSRQFVDDWLDLDTLVTRPAKNDWRVTPDIDIVLLRHSTEKKSIMAKVSLFRNTFLGIQVGLRCCTKAFANDPGLIINSMWRLSSVFSLSTLHREFAALMALPYYDMASIILKPRLSDPAVPNPDDIQRTMKVYEVNEPQAKAIISSMRTSGFSLIQGPPGTGKTWTICGLVGVFLSARKNAPTPVVAGKKAEPVQKPPVQKILLCAPSNAAIDEVAKRLIEGVRGSNGQKLTPKVVRVGADAQINVSAKEISLDFLVAQKLGADGNKELEDAGSEAVALRKEIDSVKELRQKKSEELQNTSNNASRTLALEEEIKGLNAKRMALSQRLDRLKDMQKSQNRSLDAIRRRYRYEILAEADVICSTLSGAGHEQLEQFDFSMVVIDEAAQAIELSSLIPLKYRCTQCIMVGDPQQLPPTVLSPEASKWGYDQSLFVRMQKQRPSAVHLLSIQYRMHPEISRLPSRLFYDGRLQDGPDMAEKTAQPWHAEPRFGIYKFFSATQGREEPGRIGHSLLNREECKIIAAIYDRIRKQFSSIDFDYRIGIVSMYRAQVQELRRVFQQRFGPEITGKIDFNTVDGFQGQEKDIIILSCVRAGPSLQTVGFLADVRRMNVAITRSRSSLFIVGHGPTLERSNETWKGIVIDAQSRSCFVELSDTSYFTKNTGVPNAGTEKERYVPRTTSASIAGQGATVDGLELFSPKLANTPASRRLPKGVKVKAQTGRVDGPSSSAPSEQPSTSLVGQKRAYDKDHEHRPPPTERDASAQPSGSGMTSLVNQRQPVPPAQEQRPPTNTKQESEAERMAAQRALDALRKRKKDRNNLFIKR
ncbi:hypothetical protein M0805_000126 [Coniferiporia weirii]|nr:hypothetical protein M0805_000126 [Coniferiporia weirii]